MLRSALWFVIALNACWAIASAEAQETSEPVRPIGVCHDDVAVSVSHLLGTRARSEVLWSSRDWSAWQTSGQLPSYEIINQRAVRLRSSSVYFYRTGTMMPDDSLWRERLAGQGVRLIHVPSDTAGLDLNYLAFELTKLFPEQRDTIAENLHRELRRRQPENVAVDLALHGSD